VDIAAPGESLKSCGILHDADYDTGGVGTSYAAPVVAAAAGLLWSYRPELTLAQVRAALEDTGPVAPGFTGVVRRLDIYAALQSVIVPVIPSIAGVSQQPYENVGVVANKGVWNVNLQSPVNVSRATYTLDLAPIGTEGPEDIVVETTTGGSSPAQFDLTAMRNQAAALKVAYFSTTNHTGSLTISPLWIYTQRGDFDGDGTVAATDLLALQPLIGLRSTDPGYLGYLDNDGDYRITEADAAAVGYNYGAGAVLPEISAVSPTSGITGADASFTASVDGSGQLDYSWDFGGGATPNVSLDPAPTVTLGAAGDYSASLTVTSSFGSDTFPFTLSVTARPDPTAALSATPRIGLAPLNVSFDASASSAPGGSIVQYDWSWDGDAVFEDTTATPDNAHVFPDLGEYTVRLRVTDDLSRTAETTVDISVIDGITVTNSVETELGPWGKSYSSSGMIFTAGEVSGRPALAWVRCDFDSEQKLDELYIAVARTDAPESIADWRVDMVYSGELEDGIGGTCAVAGIDGEAVFLYAQDNGSMYYGRYHGDTYTVHALPGPSRYGAVGSIGGLPVVLAGPGSDLHYLYANSADPQSAADWTDVPMELGVDLSSPYGIPYKLHEVNGRAALLYEANDSGNWVYTYATANPPGPGDWATCLWDGDHTGSEDLGYFFMDGALPGVAFRLEPGTGYGFRYYKASTPTPAGPADWDSHDLPIRMHNAGIVGGLPAIRQNDDVYMAFTTDPGNTADWVQIPTPDQYANGALVDHAGLPAVFSIIGNSTVVYRYPVP
jgi:PKD repeat protein